MVVGEVPPPAGVVAVGVAVPPVAADGAEVAGVGDAAAPPEAAVPDEDAVVEVVDVVLVDVVAAGVVVPPDGGAVRAGVVLGTL